jgi:hypothetical protein
VGALADLAESVLGDCLSVARVLGLPVAVVCGACCRLFCSPLLIGAVGVLHTGYLKLHLSYSFYTIQVGDLCGGPDVCLM